MLKIPWEGLWEEGQYKTDLLNHFISHDKNVLLFNTSVNPLVGLSNKLPLCYKELRIKTHWKKCKEDMHFSSEKLLSLPSSRGKISFPVPKKKKKKSIRSQMLWYTPVILAPESGNIGRSGVQDQPQLHSKFEVSLGYTRAYLKIIIMITISLIMSRE